MDCAYENLCSFCGKSFDSVAKLKKHTKRIHDLNPDSCKKCGKKCFGKQQLETHMKSINPFAVAFV